MKKSLIFVSLNLLIQFTFAQNNLYMPTDIQQAYTEQTRSFDGKPGKNYWQNSADYKIDVSVYPHSRILRGQAEITYYNNSPDSLKELVVRLHPDIYRKGNPRDFYIEPTSLHDGVDIENLKIDNKIIDLNPKNAAGWRSGTNLIIPLADLIKPGRKVVIQITWEYPVATDPVRGGAYDASTFFVAYWYPQIAVYDDISGWDKSNYTGYQEFYNDFKNFDVNINLPEGFTVWATGLLENPQEVLPETQLKKYLEAFTTNEIIPVITKDDYSFNSLNINSEKNSWHFRAFNVMDFAFAFSDYFLWDATSIKLEGKDERVLINAAYNPESKDFFEVAKISQETLDYFSNIFPAITYPYPAITVFNGGGGMEWPMIVNDGTTSSWASTVGLTSHEIAHSYFPFYMGTNERKYAWMDEGMVVSFAFDFQHYLAPDADKIASRVKLYLRLAGKELETPSMISTLHQRGLTYRNAAYDKPAIALHMLRDVLGDSLYLKGLHAFVDRWNGKHPTPYDFFFTFNDVLKQDLSWFWNPWFFEQAYPDLAIKEVKQDDQEIIVLIEKVGRMPVPVNLSIEYEDGTSEKFYKTAAVWKEGNKTTELKFIPTKKVNRLVLGHEHIPDVNNENNIYKMK